MIKIAFYRLESTIYDAFSYGLEIITSGASAGRVVVEGWKAKVIKPTRINFIS